MSRLRHSPKNMLGSSAVCSNNLRSIELFEDQAFLEYLVFKQLNSCAKQGSSRQDILERLADGTMPCDEEWPDEQIDEQIDQFRRWIEVGMPP